MKGYTPQISRSIWPLDETLTGTTIMNKSGPKSNINDGVLHIPQRFRMKTSPADGLVSYPRHAEVQLVYSTISADRVSS